MRQLASITEVTKADEAIDLEIRALLDSLESESLIPAGPDFPLYDIVRYHLGFLDEDLRPALADRGKRIRPKLCLLTCAAAGGEPDLALPTAAAIEILHNFTLVHDDIQDRSPLRRHRPTVWSLWGVSQAINVGDAMFAVAHLACGHDGAHPYDPATAFELSEQLHRTTLRIVEGQALDLSFEERPDIGAADYLNMIRGKTAAIIRYACWAGARIAGSPRAGTLGDFGEALGIGFQIMDDYLGVWGAPSVTGKAAADDIRRRKKALPTVMLMERAFPPDRTTLDQLFASAELSEDAVGTVLELMGRYEIRDDVRAEVRRWHDEAQVRLEQIPDLDGNAAPLYQIVDDLGVREG